MKKTSIWLIVATLFCGLFTLTSCDEQLDNPTGDSDNIQDREEILSHIKSDAQVLADNMNPEMLNLTNEIYSQLMTLMAKDRNYMRNMKQILAMMAAKNALTKIIPVTTADYGLSVAARPFNSRLEKKKLVEAGFDPLPTWQDAVNRYLQEAQL